MNSKTKLTALFIGFLLILTMVPAFAVTATAAVLEATDVIAVYGLDDELKDGYATMEEAWAEFENGDTWKLLANTSTFNSNNQNRGLRIDNGQILTIDLNGFVLTPPTYGYSSDEEGVFRHLFVSPGGDLTIKDSNPTAVHKYRVEGDLYVLDDENGTLEIPGGVITGGATSYSTGLDAGGGAVIVQASILRIESGNFIGNKANGPGGAIRVDQLSGVAPALIISGGRIIGNHSDAEGEGSIAGSHLNSGSLILSATTSFTGGIYGDSLSKLCWATFIDKHLAPSGCGMVQDEETGWWSIQQISEIVEVDGVTHHLRLLETETPATCETEGITASKYCTLQHEDGVDCTYITGGEVIPAKGHKEMIEEAVEPTCTRSGRTEGKTCSSCGEVLVKQENLDPLGHTPGDWTSDPSNGRDYKYCSVCNDAVDMRPTPAAGDDTEGTLATSLATTAPATTTTVEEDKGCASVVSGAVGMLFVALLGGCVILRKKDD